MTPNSIYSGQKNYILASLPVEVFDRLQPQLETIQFKQTAILYNAGHSMDYVYFPTTALISWVAITEDGDRLETGMTGWEGMVSTSIVLGHNCLPYQIAIELPGDALRIKADQFKLEFDRSPMTRNLILRYAYTGLVQLAQTAVCSRFHTVESRLCRWLLTASDRVNSNTLLLTQETLAAMIGARRPAISLMLGALQVAGLVTTNRGEIVLTNRTGLEEAACECYHVVKRELDQFLEFQG